MLYHLSEEECLYFLLPHDYCTVSICITSGLRDTAESAGRLFLPSCPRSAPFCGHCCFSGNTMSYYDEIEIEDMAWDDVKRVFHYPCPCGDRFEITRAQLANYEDIAACPSCSLVIRVVYDPVSTS
jgi:diphthamide biosynthesis protein 3